MGLASRVTFAVSSRSIVASGVCVVLKLCDSHPLPSASPGIAEDVHPVLVADTAVLCLGVAEQL